MCVRVCQRVCEVLMVSQAHQASALVLMGERRRPQTRCAHWQGCATYAQAGLGTERGALHIFSLAGDRMMEMPCTWGVLVFDSSRHAAKFMASLFPLHLCPRHQAAVRGVDGLWGLWLAAMLFVFSPNRNTYA